MKESQLDRRRFIRAMTGTAAVISALPRKAFGLMTTARDNRAQEKVTTPPRIKFAVIGINHDHIHGQIEAVTRGGGELVSFYAKEADLAATFSKRYPQVKLVRGENEILEDPAIQLVVSAGIPNERGPLGVRVM